MKRYQIQFAFLEDTLRGEAKWYNLRSGASRRRRRAVEKWWTVVSNNNHKRLYRLMDTKTNKVIR